MPDRERELERELRELGALISYPPTPDAARAARNLLDEEEDERPRRFSLSFPTLRWAAVAAAFVLVVALPALSPGLRATVSDWFVAGDTQMAGGPAVDAGSPERESEANVPASGASKSSEAVTTPALTPQFSGERISLREAQARMGGALLLPRTPQLGKPDEIYTSPKDGVVLVYRAGLPPLADTGISLVLTEVPGDLEPAYLAGKTAVGSKLDSVMVDGHPGYWGPAEGLPSPMDRHLTGDVLLWEQGGVALRLEANLQKEQAVRIAESVR
ncbi:MAG: DUF4367 domain-containing protein [Actinomycetota bacterium]|nr:hypothetical protein [Rubrobacteraceae bacterium]MDQ3496445.1 DUF4367 domain-containing protein [Actinomycetota bacterium]